MILLSLIINSEVLSTLSLTMIGREGWVVWLGVGSSSVGQYPWMWIYAALAQHYWPKLAVTRVPSE